MWQLTWSEKTAVVCGASAGLGREFACELSRQHVAKLAVIARSADRLDALKAEIQQKYPHVQLLCLTADMTCKEQLAEVAQRVHATFGSVDLLVQAVGQSDRGRLLELTKEKIYALLDANVLSSLFALQCFASVMRQPGGSVVLIGSLASKFAPRFLGGYAIAKHGLAALAQQARLEFADQGLHVMLACPGPIARADAGQRYDRVVSESVNLPDSVRQPGGGAKLRGLDAAALVRDILQSAKAKKPEIVRPFKARCLLWLSALSVSLGDRLLRKSSG